MESIKHVIEPECHLWGTEFYPSLLHSIENIEFRHTTELGEIATRGRYKGRPVPYSACNLLVPSKIKDEDRITWMAEFILLNKEKFEEAGATDIIHWIYWTGVQGSMSFTPKELQLIAKANVPLCIDYMHIEGDIIKL